MLTQQGGRRAAKHGLCPQHHTPIHVAAVRGRAARWRGTVAAAPDDSANDTSSKNTALLLAAGGAVGGAALTVWREPLEDWLFYTSISTGGGWGGFGVGDIVGGVLWAVSLWYCSPLQALLIFMGRIDAERPSDWVIARLGQLLNQPVDVPYAVVSAPVQLLARAGFLSAGLAIAALLNLGLGDATWSVSTGLGSCLVAGVYEVGRPRRVTASEAQQLDDQWRDFVTFARARLQRGGRCHESEVFAAFRRAMPKYRPSGAIEDDVLRDMVRQYHRGAERTPNGFYKNLSLTPQVDSFTGKTTGTVLPSSPGGGTVSAQELLQDMPDAPAQPAPTAGRGGTAASSPNDSSS